MADRNVRAPGAVFEEVVGGLGGLDQRLDPLAELVIPGAGFAQERRPRLRRRQPHRLVEQILFAIPSPTHTSPLLVAFVSVDARGVKGKVIMVAFAAGQPQKLKLTSGIASRGSIRSKAFPDSGLGSVLYDHAGLAVVQPCRSRAVAARRRAGPRSAVDSGWMMDGSGVAVLLQVLVFIALFFLLLNSFRLFSFHFGNAVLTNNAESGGEKDQGAAK